MNRHICIHGHFYQPPRENPWLDAVELQDSAYPYHDWNERINAECYAPNTASRIFDSEGRIKDIVNNYSSISFNFGPTLLSWLKNHQTDIYQAILEADAQSQKKFSGHGSAIAQVYNHMIMPLANPRDKHTQVIWGIRDFIHHFHRDPEGMWLAETAVDLETLDILTEHGIKFTILAPHQAAKTRKLGDRDWTDVSGQKIDPKRPYLCNLPSGRTIVIFFYDGPISSEVSFQDTLDNGDYFADRLSTAFSDTDEAQLLNIATDGETYGHHHKYGEMALTYCIHLIQSKGTAQMTVYGEFLAEHPPTHEVHIFENTSWSCSHGIERWRSDCGCNIGTNSSWTQAWRAPLREALDWLRDALIPLYEKEISLYVSDPWGGRNDYIQVVLDRTANNLNRFLTDHQIRELQKDEKIKVLKLLEIQRQCLLMYTSCGWFFDEISGLESRQILSYAACAMQLAREICNTDFEPAFMDILQKAPSNMIQFNNGKDVYCHYIKPSVSDLLRVGAHYAISSLFKDYPHKLGFFCYTAESRIYEVKEAGIQRLAIGQTKIISNVTWDESDISFAILHLGDHNIVGGVRRFLGEAQFDVMKNELDEVFLISDIPAVIALIEKHFGADHYSLWHIFKDEQRKILNYLISSAIKERENSFKHAYKQYYPIMQVMKEMQIPLPKSFSLTADYTLNTEIAALFDQQPLNLNRISDLIEESTRWSIVLDQKTLNYKITLKLNQLLREALHQPDTSEYLQQVSGLLELLEPLSLDIKLWEAQNIYFSIIKKHLTEKTKQAEQDKPGACEWMAAIKKIGDHLQIKNIE